MILQMVFMGNQTLGAETLNQILAGATNSPIEPLRSPEVIPNVMQKK